MVKHGKQTKLKWGRIFWLGISSCLLIISFIFSNTILNADRAADQISRSPVSTQITDNVNQQLKPLTEGQIKVPKDMVEQLVHDKVKQAYTSGKVEFNQQDVRPNVEKLVKSKLPNIGVVNWLSDKLAQQVSPILVKKLNQQVGSDDNQRVAYQIYQARQMNQWIMWCTLVLTILLGLFTALTTNLWHLISYGLLIVGSLLLVSWLGLSLGSGWYLDHELQQLLELASSIKPLFNMASYQIGLTGGILLLLCGLVWIFDRRFKSR